MKKHNFLMKQLLAGTFSLAVVISSQNAFTGVCEKSLREKMQEMNIKVPDAEPVYGNPKNKTVKNNKEKNLQDKKSYGITREVLLNQMEKMGMKPTD